MDQRGTLPEDGSSPCPHFTATFLLDGHGGTLPRGGAPCNPLRSRSDLGLDSEELDSHLSLGLWGTGDRLGRLGPFRAAFPDHSRWKGRKELRTDDREACSQQDVCEPTGPSGCLLGA